MFSLEISVNSKLREVDSYGEVSRERRGVDVKSRVSQSIGYALMTEWG